MQALGDIDTIENVQRRAARFVTNNYSWYASVTEMLSNLSWPTLTRCRNKQKAIMLYKIINCQVDINTDNLLVLNPDIYHTRGHNRRFTPPVTRIDSYKFSLFSIPAIKIWNFLPQHVINSTEIEQFMHNLAGLDTIQLVI